VIADRNSRGYDSAMQYEDDTAFQRAILANPADTTLKLVYADWLQDRADPRGEYVRAQVEGRALPEGEFDPAWVAFMTTLAQPFAPITFQDGEPGHPFTEPVGQRGRIVAFESQYRSADAWSEELLMDLALFTNFAPTACCWYGASDPRMYGFVCELPTEREPLTARDVLTALKAADFQSEHIATLDATAIPYPGYHPLTENDEIHTEFAEQYVFDHDSEGAEDAGVHGLLKRYVTGGRLWYVLLHTGGRPCWMVTLLAVGRSPHGNRLVGAITSQACHNLCD
jgi:uncharacterized protein (TIGR02996 family)